ncbi:MAG: outer membrane beta-barrel protein [Janthinobacterium lividum]
MNQLLTPTLAAALLLGAAPASAQTTFRLGLRGGANRAQTTVAATGNSSGYYPLGYSTDKAALYAWQAGVVLEASRGNFAFQPALLFSQKGERASTSLSVSGIVGNSTFQATTTNRYNWLEIPLNVVYTLHGDHGLQVFAGPYVALGLGGRQRGSTTAVSYYGPVYDPLPGIERPVDERISYGESTNNRRLDVGVNFGVGYRRGPVQVQLGYGLGLRNLHQPADTGTVAFAHEFAADAAYNRVAQLTGTYFFSL